jgi:site-specific DNA-methyltransferase (adenine-specific)
MEGSLTALASCRLIDGDCVEELASLDEASVDAVVTDPPYGIGLTGQEWDSAAIKKAAARDRKDRKSLGPESESRPGRKQSRSTSAFGSAAHYAGPVAGGKEFQDWCEVWAVEALRVLKPGGIMLVFSGAKHYHRLATAIEDAGFEIRDQLMWLFGSGFPRSHDVSQAMRKSGAGKKAVAQWSGWGTALKPSHEPVVLARKPLETSVADTVQSLGTGGININGCRFGADNRWPGNVMITEQAGAEIDKQSSDVSRFFYCPKVSRLEKSVGLPTNSHPTVKPIDLMRYLCRLVTAPGGVILDPFLGSGTTGIAAGLEGFDFIGIEREPEYMEIAKARMAWWADKSGETKEILAAEAKRKKKTQSK